MKVIKNNTIAFCEQYDEQTFLNYIQQKMTTSEKLIFQQHLNNCSCCSNWVEDMNEFFNDEIQCEIIEDEYTQQTEVYLCQLTQKQHKQLIFKRFRWNIKQMFQQCQGAISDFFTALFAPKRLAFMSSLAVILLFVSLFFSPLDKNTQEVALSVTTETTNSSENITDKDKSVFDPEIRLSEITLTTKPKEDFLAINASIKDLETDEVFSRSRDNRLQDSPKSIF